MALIYKRLMGKQAQLDLMRGFERLDNQEKHFNVPVTLVNDLELIIT